MRIDVKVALVNGNVKVNGFIGTPDDDAMYDGSCPEAAPTETIAAWAVASVITLQAMAKMLVEEKKFKGSEQECFDLLCKKFREMNIKALELEGMDMELEEDDDDEIIVIRIEEKKGKLAVILAETLNLHMNIWVAFLRTATIHFMGEHNMREFYRFFDCDADDIRNDLDRFNETFESSEL